MTTIINSNGRRSSDSIEALLLRLADHPLDRSFERFGNFIQHDARNLKGEPLEGIAGAVCFFGNFYTYSHVFNIVTDDPAVIEPLAAAIAENVKRPDYLAQVPPFYPERLTIERKRFSITQGEVLLIYDGQRLEQYGDRIELKPSGEYHGYPDPFWMDVARKELARRHTESLKSPV